MIMGYSNTEHINDDATLIASLHTRYGNFITIVFDPRTYVWWQSLTWILIWIPVSQQTYHTIMASGMPTTPIGADDDFLLDAADLAIYQMEKALCQYPYH